MAPTQPFSGARGFRRGLQSRPHPARRCGSFHLPLPSGETEAQRRQLPSLQPRDWIGAQALWDPQSRASPRLPPDRRKRPWKSF